MTKIEWAIFFNTFTCFLWPCVTSYTSQALTGHSFVYTLPRSDFDTTADASDPITLSVSLTGLPDLPSWMRFVQADMYEDGYLYGTPSEPVDEHLQVVALNKKTYKSTTGNVTIQVSKSTVSAKYRVQLYVRNLNIEDVFVDNRLKTIRDAVYTHWPGGGDVFVTRVSTYQDMGHRIPIPSYIGEVVKNGVFVEIGGTQDFSIDLKKVTIEIKVANCREGGNSKPPVTIDTVFSPSFLVDWCDFKLVTVNTNTRPPNAGSQTPSAVDLGNGVFQPMEDMPARLDLFPEFLLAVLVPATVGVLLVLVLSCLFFGYQNKRGARERQTPDYQLQQYASVRYATDRLRSMSQHRENSPTPVQSHAETAFQPDDVSTPASLHMRSRHAGDSVAPPPYRLPPSYSANVSLRSEDTDFGDQRTDDDLQLVPGNRGSMKY